MSIITTHVLDTSQGRPGAGIKIILFRNVNEGWKNIAEGITNEDGRITDLLKKNNVEAGIYKLKFETKEYFDKKSTESFYPFIEIIFEIKKEEHYHVPLLLNPYGYSTYRGS